LLIKAYNEIARQNEQNSFIDAIVANVGLPNWEKSLVFYNSENRENLTLIPLAKTGSTSVSAVIALTKVQQENNVPKYFINTMSRQQVLANIDA
jgi:hypothetical protein